MVAAYAAVNTGITAATFFALREYAVGPVLVHTAPWTQYERRRRQLGLSSSNDSELTWSEIRTNKLLDTAVSGAAAGGLLRVWRSGLRSILPGAISAAALCTILQLAYNEAAVARLRYVSKLKETGQMPVAPTPPPPEPSERVPVAQRILTALGLIHVSDEEYLLKLKRTRAVYQKRIIELEQQSEAERELKDVQH
ncbi:uncharacterized protein LACBIDRAFT_295264 [Laccaria bicolor S238N-H82]|uniref:Predicted protein n=1 Tax=Laccaria bicolor (strain S238N-H82 / ATCC MYA-4686) TaxID=486041 RepID=B0DPX8_LACBS|nr:uncharacterized protein LACBIDRAFT_295264 [Laccaria bicolor S238N-H82]EDR03193.1 predicted protein [Laccaria bicolor S238N-H82]|eukprot:XP_001885989.1 predicted protein [Laccaria bicolor S238N-H82]